MDRSVDQIVTRPADHQFHADGRHHQKQSAERELKAHGRTSMGKLSVVG
jgi:hypothetical protein